MKPNLSPQPYTIQQLKEMTSIRPIHGKLPPTFYDWLISYANKRPGKGNRRIKLRKYALRDPNFPRNARDFVTLDEYLDTQTPHLPHSYGVSLLRALDYAWPEYDRFCSFYNLQ